MDSRVNVTLDDDLYDYVTAEHNRTGRSKSKVVNDHVRQAKEHTEIIEHAKEQATGSEPSLADTLFPVFGQSLFIAGFVLAFFITLGAGVGTSFLGLAMLVGAKSDEYAKAHGVDRRTAFIKVLGA
jgi:hypothetical protein